MTPFDDLEQHYPEIIGRMKPRFSAHEFILALAHAHQGLYIKALSQYADNRAPFQAVHGQLATLLYNFPKLIQKIGEESSTDIFGHSAGATVWKKK
jgi:hypothetical protein